MRIVFKVGLTLAVGLIVMACVYKYQAMPNYDPDKSHHRKQGFKNNYPHPSKDWGDVALWILKEYRPDPRKYNFPMAQNDPAWLKSNRQEPTLTWIGHATFLLQVNGKNILTDPHLTERASPLPVGPPVRKVEPGLTFSELPHIDAVVISHNHYDHLDLPTIQRLAAQPGGPPLFLVPLGIQAWMREQGINTARELDWWEQVAALDLNFHFVPAQHFSSRIGVDRNKTLWGGWVIEAPGLRSYFAGDTGYSKDFKDIGARFDGFDLALIPIGAYDPRSVMAAMHVTPEEAIKIHQDVGSRHSVGMHWGTFRLTVEPMDEPPQRMASARANAGIAEKDFVVMQHGETRKIAHLMR
ncbi:MAG: MBL fold metallo-hydrolase [Salinisphaeraceae bacterium]|nr:MBL fold metallo-hydrolase [Salinisphaeraceae bacterium]